MFTAYANKLTSFCILIYGSHSCISGEMDMVIGTKEQLIL